MTDSYITQAEAVIPDLREQGRELDRMMFNGMSIEGDTMARAADALEGLLGEYKRLTAEHAGLIGRVREAEAKAANWAEIDRLALDNVLADRDAALARAQASEAELVEAHAHFAVQEGRLREAVARAEKVEAVIERIRDYIGTDGAVWGDELRIDNAGLARALGKPVISVDLFREKRSEQARNAKSWTSDEAILEQINASLGGDQS